MKAMVLAAGLGERMWPLTEERAKPSLPLINRPRICHTLKPHARQGVTEIVINLHCEPETIRGLVGDGRKHGLKVHYSDEPVIQGTAGGLKKAEPLLNGSGPFLMVNSDSVSDCDLTAAVKQHGESGALATMVLLHQDPRADYGTVEMDGRQRIVRVAGRPEGSSDPGIGRFFFAGIHVFEPEIFDHIPAGKSEINSDIYPKLISADRVIRGYLHTGLWREMGNPRLYLEGALAVLREGKDPTLAPLQGSEGIYLDRVPAPKDVAIEPPLFMSRGANVAAGSSL